MKRFQVAPTEVTARACKNTQQAVQWETAGTEMWGLHETSHELTVAQRWVCLDMALTRRGWLSPSGWTILIRAGSHHYLH